MVCLVVNCSSQVAQCGIGIGEKVLQVESNNDELSQLSNSGTHANNYY